MMRKLGILLAAALAVVLLPQMSRTAADGSKKEPAYMEVKIQPERARQRAIRKSLGKLKNSGGQQKAGKSKFLTSPLWGLR